MEQEQFITDTELMRLLIKYNRTNFYPLINIYLTECDFVVTCYDCDILISVWSNDTIAPIRDPKSRYTCNSAFERDDKPVAADDTRTLGAKECHSRHCVYVSKGIYLHR